MNIARMIKDLKEHYDNPDRKVVLDIVASSRSEWQGSVVPLNEKINNLSKLIHHLERNYTYVPSKLYDSLVRMNQNYNRIVHRNFKQEYSANVA
ncbi:MAG TPA: hypothetical protein VGA21_04305 [Cyclobacteriaceae bacterium]|jgi:hypothetical protein